MRLKILLAIVLLAGCAGTSKQPHGSIAWVPECRAVGCEEPNAGVVAPDGAVLSFNQCIEGVDRAYRYRRAQGSWVMTAFSASASGCSDATE